MRNANPRSDIFVITRYSAVEPAVEGIRARIDAYLVKPVNYHDYSLDKSLIAEQCASRHRKGGAN